MSWRHSDLQETFYSTCAVMIDVALISCAPNLLSVPNAGHSVGDLLYVLEIFSVPWPHDTPPPFLHEQGKVILFLEHSSSL